MFFPAFHLISSRSDIALVLLCSLIFLYCGVRALSLASLCLRWIFIHLIKKYIVTLNNEDSKAKQHDQISSAIEPVDVARKSVNTGVK